MRVVETITEVLAPCLLGLDRRIARTMVEVAEAAARVRQLSLTALGRALHSEAKAKHSIKRVDRLLGNAAVHRGIDGIYGLLSARLLAGARQAVVLIDWTDAECEGFVALSASLATGRGRAVILRHEVYPLRNQYDGRIERRFLSRLRSQLPAGLAVTVVSDAGFHINFFRAVRRLGWDFVGRLTRQMYLERADQAGPMQRVDRLAFALAQITPRSLGPCLVTAAHRFRAHVVVVRQVKRGRHGSPHRTRKGTHPGAPAFKKHQRRGCEPWVLASSLEQSSATHIVRLYEQRMQIEQCFRDLKNARFGLAFEHARSRSAQRVAVLLLIATLVAFWAFTVGAAAEAQRLHRALQANTVARRVLSRVVLALSLVSTGSPNQLSRAALRRAQRQLQREIAGLHHALGAS